jgi:signal transduction histidine kinase
LPTPTALIILFISNTLTLIALVWLVIKKTQLHRQLDKTEHYLKSREEFNALVVHELRTPLSLINGSTDTILRHKDLKRPLLEDLVTSIKTSAESMLELVSAILDLAKMEEGKFSVTKEKNDLDELVAETVDSFLPLATEKGLKLNFEKSQLPEVPMDSFRIRQVLNNLLANAIKYTDKGSIKVFVTHDDTKATVCVQDQGRGIAEEEIPKLFTRYNRLASSKGSIGSGLGLAAAKGIVEAHGGRIWVKSRVGEGSTFCFSLPPA